MTIFACSSCQYLRILRVAFYAVLWRLARTGGPLKVALAFAKECDGQEGRIGNTTERTNALYK